jgi:NarL family two-component system response regulator LiaR
MDGVKAMQRIGDLSPDTKVIALTSFGEDEKVFSALEAGASGYLLKDVSPHDLISAIQATHRGEAYLHPGVAKKVVGEFSRRAKEPSIDELTERELEVLRLIARGLSNRDIAEELVVSEKTVKTHVSSILSKLHLDARTQAAIYAIKRGLEE